MQINYITMLLKLKGVKITNITEEEKEIKVHITTKVKEHICPCCGEKTKYIKDYRKQNIKHSILNNKIIILVLNKRRYHCKNCGKNFYEKYDFINKYQRCSTIFYGVIYSKFNEVVSFSHIAREVGVSVATILRLFNYINYPKPTKLPKVLCIDEFKGDADGEKFQCILVDGEKGKVLDILPNRSTDYLKEYFRSFSMAERLKVKFFISDLWKPYKELAKEIFPNAIIIADKYHFQRQVTWAIENTRKRVQKSLSPEKRKYFKRSKKLFTTHYDKLSDEDKQALEVMFWYSEDLRVAHTLKEEYYRICNKKDKEELKKEYANWIYTVENSNLKEFNACTTAFHNWFTEIINAFKYNYTNGITEGLNNKTKVIKRVSYGIKKFKVLRNKILCCNA